MPEAKDDPGKAPEKKISKRKTRSGLKREGPILGLKDQDPKEIVRKIKDENGVARALILMERRKSAKTKRPYLYLTDDGIRFAMLMFAYNSSIEEVAAELGVSCDVLMSEANSARVLSAREEGYSRFRNSIRRSQRDIMRSGDSRMAIWLGKNYLGQKDSVQDVSVKTVSNPSDMSLDEMMAAIARAEKKDGE